MAGNNCVATGVDRRDGDEICGLWRETGQLNVCSLGNVVVEGEPVSWTNLDEVTSCSARWGRGSVFAIEQRHHYSYRMGSTQ
jgi:hypothetical protein